MEAIAAGCRKALVSAGWAMFRAQTGVENIPVTLLGLHFWHLGSLLNAR